MSLRLIELITSADDTLRHRSLDELCAGASFETLLAECDALEAFRHRSENLYERVRALMFLQTIHRYVVQESPDLPSTGLIPFEGFTDLMERRFEQAIAAFREEIGEKGPDGAIASALMPRLPRSRAMVNVMPAIAAFAAL